jgi:hypothetical protein
MVCSNLTGRPGWVSTPISVQGLPPSPKLVGGSLPGHMLTQHERKLSLVSEQAGKRKHWGMGRANALPHLLVSP